MTEQRPRPIAILVLGVLHIFVAFRGIWNLVHNDSAMQALRHISQWNVWGVMTLLLLLAGLVVGMGLIELKRWAFFISIAWSTIYLVNNLARGAYLPMIVSAVFVTTLFHYRRAFAGRAEESANQAL